MPQMRTMHKKNLTNHGKYSILFLAMSRVESQK